MNIKEISLTQQPIWNPLTNGYMHPTSYFKQYAEFCMSRRTYKKGRKGLTHMGRNIGRSKYPGKVMGRR
jgi:hypothetical protein